MVSDTIYSRDQADSPYAAMRLGVTLLLMMLSASGMYVVPVVLPTVQAEFGIARADASLSYSMLMIGFGAGGVLRRLPSLRAAAECRARNADGRRRVLLRRDVDATGPHRRLLRRPGIW